MFDEDAPIGAADVDEAVRFLRLWRLLRVVGGGCAILGCALGVVVVDGWQQHRAAFAWCEGGVVAVHADLAAALPPDAVVHKGPHGVVIDTPRLAALVVDGRVVASTLRCGPGERMAAQAWRWR